MVIDREAPHVSLSLSTTLCFNSGAGRRAGGASLRQMAQARRCQSANPAAAADKYRIGPGAAPIVDGMAVRMRLTKQVRDRWCKLQETYDGSKPLPTLGFTNPSLDLQKQRKLEMNKEQKRGLDAQMKEKALVVQAEAVERQREQAETDDRIQAFKNELKDQQKEYIAQKMQLKKSRETDLKQYVQHRTDAKANEKKAAALKLATLAEELQVERTQDLSRRRDEKARLTKVRNQFLGDLQMFQQKERADRLNEETLDPSCWLMSPGYHDVHKAGLASKIDAKMERRYAAYAKVAPPTWNQLAKRDQAKAQAQFESLQEEERRRDEAKQAKQAHERRDLLSTLDQQRFEKHALRTSDKADALYLRSVLEEDDRRAARQLMKQQKKERKEQERRRKYLERQSVERAVRAEQPIETQIARRRSKDLGDTGMWN